MPLRTLKATAILTLGYMSIPFWIYAFMIPLALLGHWLGINWLMWFGFPPALFCFWKTWRYLGIKFHLENLFNLEKDIVSIEKKKE